VPALASLAAHKGYRIYMLGARPEVAQRARERLLCEYPDLQIVGCVSPIASPLLEMGNEPLLQDIERTRPDILLVAFGNPKQEKWIHMHHERLRDVPVCIGIGGTFDFLAGETQRAPLWMQRTGLEWLHRLAHEPRRLARRYARGLIFFPLLVVWQVLKMRMPGKRKQSGIEETRSDRYTTLAICGPLDPENLAEFKTRAHRALNRPNHLILDLSATTYIDAAAMGALVDLAWRAETRQCQIRIVGASAAVRDMLSISDAKEQIPICNTLAAALAGCTPESLEVEIQADRARAVCALFGAADHQQASLVEARLKDLPIAVRRVDLDLRAVSYIDCEMMDVLRRFADEASIQGRRVRLAASSSVKMVMDRERIANHFEWVETPFVLNILSFPPPVYKAQHRRAS
jgi:N-acetylglucosaminyldiphosphoundecaprenol N-acetyl-beta-D-mannosaminyltransferase